MPKPLTFDEYLDRLFAGPNWHDGCVSMLAAFLETIDSCRDDPEHGLPRTAPSIVDQTVALAGQLQRLEHRLRDTAERGGPGFQTSEMAAVLWWSGMALHKAAAAAEGGQTRMAAGAWDEAFFEIHAQMYETMSAVSLIFIAERLLHHLGTEGIGDARPN
jgi:hypothetical protein